MTLDPPKDAEPVLDRDGYLAYEPSEDDIDAGEPLRARALQRADRERRQRT